MQQMQDSKLPSDSMVTAYALLRHQTGSVIATAVDFSVMIALVSLAGAAPAAGTAAGAACGAIVNFMLGRRWVFRATQGKVAPQAVRYIVIATGSLLLNTGGVHLLAEVMLLPYVAARVAVSLGVSLCWNFPLQKIFVFRESKT
jgi:putative flippase GtrA